MMHAHSRPAVKGPIVAAVLLALALLVVWAAVPEAMLVPILLFGVVAEVLLYVGLYVVERRRRW
jgi:hypothetical protein